jgi:predicted RNA-binding Zn ribbon-like protein
MSSDSAPGQLELVRHFVNTLEIDPGEVTEELETPEQLASWLSEHDLLPRSTRLGSNDLRRAVALREALRGLLLANNGGPLEPTTVAALNRAVSDASVSLRFDDRGRAQLEAVGSGVDAALARIAAIVFEAMVEGTWPRLKACAADDCHWAFYDHSRNRSGTWCSMAVCGNRAKVRAYRERRTQGDR